MSGGAMMRTADRVSVLLWRAQDCQPSAAEVALALCMGERTLARQLRSEGVGFRQLAEHVRLQRSRLLLAEGRLSVTAVALTLGYSDVANFSRWFRRACGLSPGAFRQAQGGGL